MPAPSEDQIAELLGQFPGSLTLRPSASKWLRILAIALGFVALGVIFIVTPGTFAGDGGSDALSTLLMTLRLAGTATQAVAALGWMTVIFFGAGAAVGIVALLPGASGLTLNRDGFVIVNLYRHRAARWQDVSAFAVAEVNALFRTQKLVGYDDRTAKGARLAALNVSLSGYNSALPDTYGLSCEDLARLMSLWRERVVKQTNR